MLFTDFTLGGLQKRVSSSDIRLRQESGSGSATLLLTLEDKNVREALPNFDNLLTFCKHTYPVKFSKFLQSLKFWGNKISLAYPLSY